jgi:hypothetical protein
MRSTSLTQHAGNDFGMAMSPQLARQSRMRFCMELNDGVTKRRYASPGRIAFRIDFQACQRVGNMR